MYKVLMSNLSGVHHLLDCFTVFQCDFRKVILISILKIPKVNNESANLREFFVVL